MTVPYTYYLYHKPTGKKYYGVRWAMNCSPDDLWKTYFTSSKYVHELIEQYGVDSFDHEIRKIFDTSDSAILWEKRVLTRLHVLNNDTWINKNISGSIKNDVHPLLNKHHSEETKRKISASNSGKTRSDEVKKNMSEKRSGPKHWNYGKVWDDETKEKNRQTNIMRRQSSPELFVPPPSTKGMKMSDEAKKKMSDARKKYWAERKKVLDI
jgi:hypothetical protein